MGRTTTYTYDGSGGIEPFTVTYDIPGRSTLSNDLGESLQLSFYSKGKVRRSIDPLGRVTRFDYDTSLRLAETAWPDGTTTRYAWWRGLLENVTDPAGRKIMDAVYDPFPWRMTSIKDAKGNETLYDYDANGNLVGIAFADGAAETFTRGIRGTLASLTNARGQMIDYTYTGCDRLSEKDVPGSATAEFAYDGHRNLISVVDASGTTQYEYDAMDRLTKLTLPNGKFLEYTYDAAGNRESVDDDGTVTDYMTNVLNQYTSVGTAAYAYDDDGNIQTKREHLDVLLSPGGEWADKMGDNFIDGGYLLIVGETEIIPAFACSYYLAGNERKCIEFTDNYYSNTLSDTRPRRSLSTVRNPLGMGPHGRIHRLLIGRAHPVRRQKHAGRIRCLQRLLFLRHAESGGLLWRRRMLFL